jgi:hypothetical protein
MRKKELIICFLVAVSSLAGNCSKQRCSMPPNETSQPPKISKSIRVDVFLDGTSSMKGFIVPGIASRYQQVLPLLESVVGRGWPGAQIQFYRFGTIIEDLPDRKYLDSQKPQFYVDNRVSRETLIQNVIDRAATNNLTIIVTDLFQTDVDVNLITSKIKEKYLANGFAVGVLALRSEFSGEIFDVGPNNYHFTYNSDSANTSTFRPFYVLALGNHADVSNYFDQVLKLPLANQAAAQAVVFSPWITEKVASFDGSAITEISKLQEVRNLVPTDAASDPIKQFRIMDSAAPLASFDAKLDYKPLPYTMPVSSSELGSEITAFTCGPDVLHESNDAQRAFSIKEARLNESTLDFKAEIVPSFVPGAGTYCFRVILFPKTYKTPDWFSELNMTSEQVEASIRNPTHFNGSQLPILINLATSWQRKEKGIGPT